MGITQQRGWWRHVKQLLRYGADEVVFGCRYWQSFNVQLQDAAGVVWLELLHCNRDMKDSVSRWRYYSFIAQRKGEESDDDTDIFSHWTYKNAPHSCYLASTIWWFNNSQGRNHGWKVERDQDLGPNTGAFAPRTRWKAGLGVGCGRGSPPPAVGVRGYYPRKFFENSRC